VLKTKISSFLAVSPSYPPKLEFVKICMREPVCAVQIFVSIYGRHSPNLSRPPDSPGEMPAEETNVIYFHMFNIFMLIHDLHW
jgi:hypothetical protein